MLFCSQCKAREACLVYLSNCSTHRGPYCPSSRGGRPTLEPLAEFYVVSDTSSPTSPPYWRGWRTRPRGQRMDRPPCNGRSDYRCPLSAVAWRLK